MRTDGSPGVNPSAGSACAGVGPTRGGDVIRRQGTGALLCEPAPVVEGGRRIGPEHLETDVVSAQGEVLTDPGADLVEVAVHDHRVAEPL